MIFTDAEDRHQQELMRELDIPVIPKQQRFARAYGASHSQRLEMALEEVQKR